MRKIIFIVICFIGSTSIMLNAQTIDEIDDYIKSKETILKMLVEKESRIICRREEVKYIGNITIETAGAELPNYYYIKGIVEYESDNCGHVECEYFARIAIKIDEDDKLVCFYLNMPNCPFFEVSLLKYPEYSVREDCD